MTFEPLFGIPPFLLMIGPALILLVLTLGAFFLLTKVEDRKKLFGKPVESSASSDEKVRVEGGFTFMEVLVVVVIIGALTFGTFSLVGVQISHIRDQLNNQAKDKYGITFVEEDRSLRALLGGRYGKAIKDDGTEAAVMRGISGEFSLLDGLEKGVAYTLQGTAPAVNAAGEEILVSLRWDGAQWTLVEAATPVKPTDRFTPIETQP